MSIVATRDIAKDEEITVYYSGGYLGTKGDVHVASIKESLDFIERASVEYFETQEFERLQRKHQSMRFM